MGSIDDVRERLSIEQVVGEVVALKRAGSTFKGLCPFHHEKTPSFIVTPSRGTYKCFGCAEAGDIFSFVMKTRNMDFRDALQELAARAGVTLDDPAQGRQEDTLKTRIHEMNATAATYFQSMLGAAAGVQARAYLRRRAITAATIDRFGLGYAPDARDGLATRLRGAGYGDDDLVAAGLVIAAEEGGPVRDRFRGRLIFPIRDARGRILGFGGRLLGDGQPRYLNSPATSAFDKSRVLYAIEHAAEAIRGAREGVIVEGYVDALRAHQEGFPNVVATLGTSITEHQLHGLARLAPRLVLALDADPAGQKAAVRAGLAGLGALPRRSDPAAAGAARREPPRVYVATLPDGQDPDDAIAASPDTWRRAIAEAVPLMDHYVALVEGSLDRTRSDWRQEAIDTLAPAIGQLDGLGLQQTYIERLAALTGVDPRYLRDITPGGPPRGPVRRRDPRRRDEGTAIEQVSRADPVRVTEEYLVGLLLLHRPLAPEVRADLASYAPLTPDLAPLLAALGAGQDPGPACEETAERLLATARQQPPLPEHGLLSEVRSRLTRLDEERAKRELLDLGRVLSEVDADTAREMRGHTLETMLRKEQLTLRLQREQMQHRRQLSGLDDGIGAAI